MGTKRETLAVAATSAKEDKQKTKLRLHVCARACVAVIRGGDGGEMNSGRKTVGDGAESEQENTSDVEKLSTK